MSNGNNNPKENGGDETDAAVIVTEIEICGCTNTALERGETCGQALPCSQVGGEDSPAERGHPYQPARAPSTTRDGGASWRARCRPAEAVRGY